MLKDHSVYPPSKPTKLYPAAITLNHAVRKKEVERINRENLAMLNKLRDVKPAVETADRQLQHAMKMREIKRNLSKFSRAVGKSQPRPQIKNISGLNSEALPDINRTASNRGNPQLNQFSVNPVFVGSRRTSQGNRTYLEAKRQCSIPGTQNGGFRNNRIVSEASPEGFSMHSTVTI